MIEGSGAQKHTDPDPQHCMKVSCFLWIFLVSNLTLPWWVQVLDDLELYIYMKIIMFSWTFLVSGLKHFLLDACAE
jgi:hypothetical protein